MNAVSTLSRERTTARKSSRLGTTYRTFWDGREVARFTFWPMRGGYMSIITDIGEARSRQFREFHATRRDVMERCAEVVDPEMNGRYVQDNDALAADRIAA